MRAGCGGTLCSPSQRLPRYLDVVGDRIETVRFKTDIPAATLVVLKIGVAHARCGRNVIWPRLKLLGDPGIQDDIGDLIRLQPNVILRPVELVAEPPALVVDEDRAFAKQRVRR